MCCEEAFEFTKQRKEKVKSKKQWYLSIEPVWYVIMGVWQKNIVVELDQSVSQATGEKEMAGISCLFCHVMYKKSFTGKIVGPKF